MLRIPLLTFFFLSLTLTVSVSAESRSVKSEAGGIEITSLAQKLNHPWGMAFLPGGQLIFTERSGSLRILDTNLNVSPPLKGVPKVFASGQGGLLDVAVDPEFEKTHVIFLSFAEPGSTNEIASTALGKGRLENGELKEFKVIFRQEPKVTGSRHFGGRIVIAPDGTLFLTLGERYTFERAQDFSTHLGSIVHVTKDGAPASDNPFLHTPNARPEVWSFGHRNIEAAVIDPVTKSLWIGEMGPRGGDELNLIKKGGNYGWPLVSWGTHYNFVDIPKPPTRPEFIDAVTYWVPSISPSGMIIYQGAMFKEWRGNFLLGGLSDKSVVRVLLEGKTAREVERIPIGQRVRDLEEARDGSIYLLTDEDDGEILRLSLAGNKN